MYLSARAHDGPYFSSSDSAASNDQYRALRQRDKQGKLLHGGQHITRRQLRYHAQMQSKNLSAVLQKIATGPHLSKDLTVEQAHEAMTSILSGQVDDVQTGIFFIALRMKRETADELIGVFQAILDAVPSRRVDVPSIVTFSDPYAGYSRGLPASPFVPAVLSALGIPSVSHSPVTMSPKYGLTAHGILSACSVRTDHSLDTAAAVLENNSGWVFLDQHVISPQLAALNDLRDLIVKRPFLSTVECCLRPLIATEQSHLVTGYVHKPYPPIYAMCADVAGFDSACFIRGVEGGIVPSTAQISRYFPWQRGTHSSSGEFVPFDAISLTETPIDPKGLGIERAERSEPWPGDIEKPCQEAAQQAAEIGMKALQGEPGVMRDAIRLGAASAVSGFQKISLNSAMASIDGAFESGEVWRCFSEQRKI